MSINRLLPQQTRPDGSVASYVSSSDSPSSFRSLLGGGYMVDECSEEDRGVGWAGDRSADIGR